MLSCAVRLQPLFGVSFLSSPNEAPVIWCLIQAMFLCRAGRGVLVGVSFRGHLRTSGVRTHTLCFGHLRVGVPLFSFCFLVPLAFFSPLFDASSHRATRLSGLLLSLSCLSVSVFVIAATHLFCT